MTSEGLRTLTPAEIAAVAGGAPPAEGVGNLLSTAGNGTQNLLRGLGLAATNLADGIGKPDPD